MHTHSADGLLLSLTLPDDYPHLGLSVGVARLVQDHLARSEVQKECPYCRTTNVTKTRTTTIARLPSYLVLHFDRFPESDRAMKNNHCVHLDEFISLGDFCEPNIGDATYRIRSVVTLAGNWWDYHYRVRCFNGDDVVEVDGRESACTPVERFAGSVFDVELPVSDDGTGETFQPYMAFYAAR